MENWTLSWSKLIPFNSANINIIDSNMEGVYRLSRQEGEKIFVFYVGKGKIKDRLSNHLSESEDNDCLKATIKSYTCFFRYSIITKDEVRKAAERKMYKVYQPSCNSIEPEGRDDIGINLE